MFYHQNTVVVIKSKEEMQALGVTEENFIELANKTVVINAESGALFNIQCRSGFGALRKEIIKRYATDEEIYKVLISNTRMKPETKIKVLERTRIHR